LSVYVALRLSCGSPNGAPSLAATRIQAGLDNTMATVLTVLGARPQFIKAAPVSGALAKIGGLRELLVHTGQHFDAGMSDVFFAELELQPPAYNLGVHSLGHGAMTGRMLERLEHVILAEKPDMLLVYGDTNSTLAGALAGAKLHVPVAHVEAGLRSFNRRMPEETNRVVTDHLSRLLFCPTRRSVDNLRNEGIVSGVHHVGDVMHDMALAAMQRSSSGILSRLAINPKSYAVATIHRAENTNDQNRFAEVLAWLADVSRTLPIVMPVHPRTRKVIQERGLDAVGIRLIEPVGYFEMAELIHQAESVFTDSGGLQKEAFFHKVPCVTLRDETEWIETLEAGWNRLWTVADYQPRKDIAEFGDGQSSRRIAELIKSTLAA
jgi:UDP-GlcNAc3NAcA epimerase